MDRIGYASAQSLRKDLASVRSILTSAGYLRDYARLPVGVAYFGWELEEDDGRAREMLDIAYEYDTDSIWLSFGRDLGRSVQYIRHADQRNGREEKTKIFVLVSSVQDALVACNEWNVDVIVAQGTSRRRCAALLPFNSLNWSLSQGSKLEAMVADTLLPYFLSCLPS